MSHALYGLSKEELISDWQFEWKSGLSCNITPIGAELFLWANGKGRNAPEYIFHREFELTPLPDQHEVLLIYGREVAVDLDNGEAAIVQGYDCLYFQRRTCPVANDRAEQLEDGPI